MPQRAQSPFCSSRLGGGGNREPKTPPGMEQRQHQAAATRPGPEWKQEMVTKDFLLFLPRVRRGGKLAQLKRRA